MPESVKKVLVETIDLCTQYPDETCGRLSEDIARTYPGITAKQVLCVGGIDDAVYRIIAAQRPQRALLLAPTYEDYETALRNSNCAVQYYFLAKEEKFQITETIFDFLTSKVDIFFLCNPNNPTAQVIGKDIIERILVRCQENHILLVVDESFISFLDEPEAYTAKQFIHQYQNLVVLDGFTKLYAMPGLRLGFCLSDNKELLKKIFTAGQPWSVSIPAQIAGIVALQDKPYLQETKTLIRQEKEWLLSNLDTLKINVWGSCANYLFFPSPLPNMRQLLEQDHILLRNCENFMGLDGQFCRVAIRTRQENELFIEAVRKHMI